MHKLRLTVFVLVGVCLSWACSDQRVSDSAPSAEAAETLIPLETFTLDNGLNVIFHIDRSDPVVGVALTAHVGSAREKEGRTGFAHLFEHLLFLESENLGKGGLDRLSARIGGSGANGSTSRDRTDYFQAVPKDALEKMIWAEADKIGFFINTVTDPVLAKEKQVVKNEKRQSYDNQPYGHTNYVINKALYPKGHPYSWEVIGSLADLDAATLEDVKEFYRRWYTPNNVTLAIAGDFDPDQTRLWVEKYFGEIPRGPEVAPLQKQPSELTEKKFLFHEDNFAQLPELTITWPAPPRDHPDRQALEALAALLSEGKTAPFTQVLVDGEKLTSNVSAYFYGAELAGEFTVTARAFSDVDLDRLYNGVFKALNQFEEEGVKPEDLARIKIGQEVDFYSSLQSVLQKAFILTQFAIFSGEAGAVNQEIAKIKALSEADLMRVYEAYLKDKPFVAASFVPKGSPQLAIEGSERADVVEEKIVQGAEAAVDPSAQAEYARTPSTFDRTVEPPYGQPPVGSPPSLWRAALDNGLTIFGVTSNELPLVEFEIAFDGGHLLDDTDNPGAAHLLAEMLDKGAGDRSPEAFENAVAALGASLTVRAEDEKLVIHGQTLARNLQATMDLIEDMLTRPLWDQHEFELAKSRTISRIQSAAASPNAIASRAYAYVAYGDKHILATPVIGTERSIRDMSLDTVKAAFVRMLTPGAANLRIVGALDKSQTLRALESLEQSWRGGATPTAHAPPVAPPEKSALYFYDMPGSKQSVIRFGYPSLKRTHPDYYSASILNYRFGGGGFASQLLQQLRETKGYTYGVSSAFFGMKHYGDFLIGSNIRSNVTLEATALVRDIMEDYAANYTEEDLAVTKSFLIKSKARAFETLGAKLAVLENIADYGLPEDYLKQQDVTINAMTTERIKALDEKYFRPDQMYYVFVGDAHTQAERLQALGLGKPIMLNERLDAFLE